MLLKTVSKDNTQSNGKKWWSNELPTKIVNKIKSRLEAQERRFSLDQETW